MSKPAMLFAPGDQPLFIVWGPPGYGPRSKIFAKALGADIEFVHSVSRRGLWAAPAKYLYQFVKTVRLLMKRRPGIVFVQNPPSFAPLTIWLMARPLGIRLVIDSHSDALQSSYWTRPRWLYRRLARAAAATVVTNSYFVNLIESWGGKAILLRDIPGDFPTGGSYAFEESFNVTYVNTFARDEPLEELLAAAADMNDVTFHITGNLKRADKSVVASAPSNVVFTGFLPDEAYFALLRGSDAVMCLTTRDNTMQRGACEALSLGRPIVTSDWPLLRSYFSQGTVHVDNTQDGIRRGLEEIRDQYDVYQKGIIDLQVSQDVEFAQSFRVLAAELGAQMLNGNEGT